MFFPLRGRVPPLAVRVRPKGLREVHLQVALLGRTLANALSVNELGEVFFLFLFYNYYFRRESAIFIIFFLFCLSFLAGRASSAKN